MADAQQQVWLVTGGSGQVGGALAANPPPNVRVIAPGRAVLDLANPALDVAPLIAAEGVTAVVNCGAYTKVDQAETEEALALQINGHAPGLLARTAEGAGIPIIHVSTDYVFAGDREGWYREDDPTGPSGAYGRTKLAGEQAVATSGARNGIVRTAWVFSPGGSNFVRTMLRLGAERDSLGVVADQHGCPTHAGDLSEALGVIALRLSAGNCGSGIWHAVNAGETTWHGLASHVLARASTRYGRPMPEVRALTTAEYPTPAPRPANSRLATDKLRADFGITLRPWQDAADAAVDIILGGTSGLGQTPGTAT